MQPTIAAQNEDASCMRETTLLTYSPNLSFDHLHTIVETDVLTNFNNLSCTFIVITLSHVVYRFEIDHCTSLRPQQGMRESQ